ncbi:hypothetical protein AG1IA_05681 [Rhizoctonia solani AG-1 IA]|uniref:Uncharacterized protein n=1 Tax=Thanatephorus cucumeris (strain AG1-IA) TaxID=983506 RepID=L8WU47_THACA|nr:hypothetical protein AG1IA_05681 [Rhizoctonia solani AG-1 IA]
MDILYYPSRCLLYLNHNTGLISLMPTTGPNAVRKSDPRVCFNPLGYLKILRERASYLKICIKLLLPPY